jgi:hypothetical protein
MREPHNYLEKAFSHCQSVAQGQRIAFVKSADATRDFPEYRYDLTVPEMTARLVVFAAFFVIMCLVVVDKGDRTEAQVTSALIDY